MNALEPVPGVIGPDWKPLLHQRDLDNLRGLLRIPVGGTAHLVGQVVGMAVLDCDLDLFREAHRVVQMEHIPGWIAAIAAVEFYLGRGDGLPLKDGRAVAQESVRLHAKRLVEIIFTSGAV
jgi:hypothetical protein